MAFILKPPVGESKGIAMFTHKEGDFLRLDAPVLGPEISRFRERYVIGMHWGFRVDDAPVPAAVDFHLAKESTVGFRDPVRRLPFNSSMFTPAFFRPRDVPKQWDIISVTRTSKFKNTDQLLDCLRLVYDRRPRTRTLVLCVGQPRPDPIRHHQGLRQRYERLFSVDERERCTFLQTESGTFPFAREDIAFFYNASRVFTLFTDTEGVAKVINEALLCGCAVVVKRNFRGGGTDYLTAETSRTFETRAEGADALIDAIEHSDTINTNPEALALQISETHSVPRFEAALGALFDELGMPFAGEIVKDNLSRRLPAHQLDMLPAELTRGGTADLRSSEASLCYLRSVGRGVPFREATVSATERAQLRSWDGWVKLGQYAGSARRGLRRIASRVVLQ